MTDQKTSYQPKQIDIDSITLTNFQGQTLNLNNLFFSFNLYEDLFTSTMSIEVKIVDANSILEDFPIAGEELLYIKFQTPTTENFIEGFFDVYKVSDRQKLEERSDIYTLYGVSREFIFSANKRLTKAYNKKKISTIVRNIFNEDLKSPNGNKSIFVEDTEGIHSFIAPKTDPFDFLNFLASEAQSSQYPNQSNFIFYEDHNQFNFRTITNLIDQPAVEDLYWAEFNIESNSQNVQDDSTKIIDIVYLNQFDFIKQTDAGLFGTNSFVIDPILKKTQSFRFVYDKDFDKLKTMGGNKIITPITSHTENSGQGLSRYFTSRLSDQQYSQTSYLKDRITQDNDVFLFHPTKRQKFIDSTTASNAGLNNVGFEILIAGNSMFKPGDMINLYIPSNSMDEDNDQTFNKYFGDVGNAKFLVVRVEHVYSKDSNEYYTKMKVVKDSYAQPISSSMDDNGNVGGS